MIEYFNFLLDELIFRYDVCQCRDEHWKEGTYDKDEHVKVIRAAATALFERYTKDSLGKNILEIRTWYHIEHDISVYFIPAVRIFLDRQMSDIKARDIQTIKFWAILCSLYTQNVRWVNPWSKVSMQSLFLPCLSKSATSFSLFSNNSLVTKFESKLWVLQ